MRRERQREVKKQLELEKMWQNTKENNDGVRAGLAAADQRFCTKQCGCYG